MFTLNSSLLKIMRTCLVINESSLFDKMSDWKSSNIVACAAILSFRLKYEEFTESFLNVYIICLNSEKKKKKRIHDSPVMTWRMSNTKRKEEREPFLSESIIGCGSFAQMFRIWTLRKQTVNRKRKQKIVSLKD